MPRPTYLRLVVPDQDCEPEPQWYECPSCFADRRTPQGFLICGCGVADHGPDCLYGDDGCSCGLVEEIGRRIEGDRSDDEARGVARGWEAVLP